MYRIYIGWDICALQHSIFIPPILLLVGGVDQNKNKNFITGHFSAVFFSSELTHVMTIS